MPIARESRLISLDMLGMVCGSLVLPLLSEDDQHADGL